jgi:hypothetical protein
VTALEMGGDLRFDFKALAVGVILVEILKSWTLPDMVWETSEHLMTCEGTLVSYLFSLVRLATA